MHVAVTLFQQAVEQRGESALFIFTEMIARDQVEGSADFGFMLDNANGDHTIRGSPRPHQP